MQIETAVGRTNWMDKLGLPIDLALLLGRLLIVAALIENGIRKIATFGMTAAMMGGAPPITFNGHTFPAQKPLFYFPFPEFFLTGSLCFDLFGALLVMVGFKTRGVALFLAIYIISAITIFHWDNQTLDQVLHVMSIFPFVGGLFLIAALGGGAWSADSWLKRRRGASQSTVTVTALNYDFITNLGLLVGRILAVFGLALNSMSKVAEFQVTAAMMGGAPQLMAEGASFAAQKPLFFLPFPEFFLAASIGLDLLGAVLLCVGLKTRSVATILFAYCLLAVVIYHGHVSGPLDVRAILRALPLVGCFILLSGIGAGRWSVDGTLMGPRKT